MDDFGRSWNQAHAQIEDDMYQRDMARLLPLVQKEMAEEIKRDVLKSLEVEVIDQASPAIKQINQELDKLFKQGRGR